MARIPAAREQQWSFGPTNATDRRRRRTVTRELPDGSRETTSEDIGRTIGGTSVSPMETMGGSGIGVSGGRTTDDAWNAYFGKNAASAPKPSTTSPAALSLSGKTGSSLFDSNKAFAPIASAGQPVAARTPTSMLSEAILSNETWLDERGRATTGRTPRRYGDGFVSPYGSARVSQGRGQQADWQRKIALLGIDDDMGLI